MGDLETFTARIRQAMPDLVIEDIQLNQEGMVNDIVIVNNDLVVRFPKTEQGIQTQLDEIDLLNTIRPHVSLPIPNPSLHDRSMASYPRIQGLPLTRERLMSLPLSQQQTLFTQLARFLSDLHAAPISGRPSAANLTLADWRAMLSSLEDILFPLLFEHQRQYVRDLFDPVITGRLSLNMDVDPVLIHGDLAPYHILVSAEGETLAGIIDFGTAGLGDPAVDIATLLVHYGERFVRFMEPGYRFIPGLLERARFRAACLELEWAAIGLRHNDPSMLVAHIGTARDYPPPVARPTPPDSLGT